MLKNKNPLKSKKHAVPNLLRMFQPKNATKNLMQLLQLRRVSGVRAKVSRKQHK